MAKGDYIECIVAAGTNAFPVRITASKAGRTVSQKVVTKGGVQFIEVAETSRPTGANPKGRPTGNVLRVAMHALISVEERHEDDEPVQTALGLVPEPS